MDRRSKEYRQKLKKEGRGKFCKHCDKYAITGTKLCSKHGGKNAVGIASSNYKHGKYSQVFPERYLEKFEEYVTDKERLELNEEIAILKVRIHELIQFLDSESSIALSRNVKDSALRLNKYIRTGAEPDVIKYESENLVKTIFEASKDNKTWDEILKVLDRQKNLVESQRKREVERERLVPVSDIFQLASGFLRIAFRYIPDVEQRRMFRLDMLRMLPQTRETSQGIVETLTEEAVTPKQIENGDIQEAEILDE